MKKYKLNQKQLDELAIALKDQTLAKYHLRIQAVLLRGQNKKRKDVAEITGFSPRHVTNLSKKYVEKGLEGITTDKRSSNNFYMTPREESAFLAPFVEKAEKGEIVTIKEMHIAYQEKIGEETSTWGFNLLLKRHNWRKITPRPRHPKQASAQAIEAQKKLTLTSKK